MILLSGEFDVHLSRLGRVIGCFNAIKRLHHENGLSSDDGRAKVLARGLVVLDDRQVIQGDVHEIIITTQHARDLAVAIELDDNTLIDVLAQIEARFSAIAFRHGEICYKHGKNRE